MKPTFRSAGSIDAEARRQEALMIAARERTAKKYSQVAPEPKARQDWLFTVAGFTSRFWRRRMRWGNVTTRASAR